MSEHNGRTAGVGPGRVLGRSVSHLGSDIITLVELQTALFQVDLRQWTRGMVKAAIALVAALAFLVASAPILFISLGYYINEATDLTLSLSMLIAAGAGLLVAGVCAGLGVWMLKRDQSMFHSFKSELKQNINWLKHVLTNSTETESCARPLMSAAIYRSPPMPAGYTNSPQEKTFAASVPSWGQQSGDQRYGQQQLRPAEAAMEFFQDYARERPEVVAMWAFGIGFVLAWKLKPW